MSSLRSYLQRIDGSAPGIQGAAGAMMKHYDKSPGVAVQEWRNALIQAQGHQYLPLLYVANEVLQTSKRNRGNKFLEAFSPVLGQSLIFVCSKSDAPTVDRVRRTVKIWAERRVFSIRYVNELIKGLEPYRKGGNRQSSSPSSTKQTIKPFAQTPGGGRFSPVQEPKEEPQNDDDDDDGDTSMFGDDNSAAQNDDNSSSSDDDDDADDLFGNASKKLLNISVDFDKTTIATKKRPRSSNDDAIPGITSSTTPNKSPKAKRRASAQYLSATGLLELMNQVATQQSNYERTLFKLQRLRLQYDSLQDKKIESLVGNELLEEYKKLLLHEREIDQCRTDLHAIAQTRKDLETQALRYLPWLERALQQDKDDIAFSNKFRTQLELFRGVHGPTKEARTKRLQQEALRQQKERELAAQKQEEEERKKFADAAMFRQTEAKEGMVWNKATGEYQYPNQEESWRD